MFQCMYNKGRGIGFQGMYNKGRGIGSQGLYKKGMEYRVLRFLYTFDCDVFELAGN